MPRLCPSCDFVAMVLGNGGTPIATISHRDIATTLNIYTRAIPATDHCAAAYLGTLLTGAVSPIPAESC